MRGKAAYRQPFVKNAIFQTMGQFRKEDYYTRPHDQRPGNLTRWL